MIINVRHGVKGFFSLYKGRIDKSGREVGYRKVAGTSPNLITVGGLDMIGSLTKAQFTAANPINYFNGCHVGTSNAANTIDGTTGAATNTSLISFLAGTVTVESDTTSAEASPPYYGSRVIRYRFVAGVATGNVSEVGIAYGTRQAVSNATSAGNVLAPLFSRALIVDEFGTPVTITVTAEEFLEVVYEYRVYPPLADVVGTTTIASISTDYTLRAARVTSNQHWASKLGYDFRGEPVTTNPHEIRDGVIGAIDGSPLGAEIGDASVNDEVVLAYSLGSYYRDLRVVFGLNDGNADFRSCLIWTTLGAYQIEFDPMIGKRNTNEFRITLRVHWAIHP